MFIIFPHSFSLENTSWDYSPSSPPPILFKRDPENQKLYLKSWGTCYNNRFLLLKFDLPNSVEMANFWSHWNQDKHEFLPDFNCISLDPTVQWNYHLGVILHLWDGIHLNRYEMTVLKKIKVDCDISLNLCLSNHWEWIYWFYKLFFSPRYLFKWVIFNLESYVIISVPLLMNV